MKTVTVAELAEALKAFPPDLPVFQDTEVGGQYEGFEAPTTARVLNVHIDEFGVARECQLDWPNGCEECRDGAPIVQALCL